MQAITLREILRLILSTSFSNRKIARLTQASANTVKRYRHKLSRTKRSWPDIESMGDLLLKNTFSDRKPRHNNGKRIPDWHYYHSLMQKRHQTLVQLWEEYRSIDPSDAYSYSQFTHYYRQYIQSIDISMRQTHYAGECVFVDYAGKTINWTDSDTGLVHQAHIFVGVLGCSRYTFAYACRSQNVAEFTHATVKMFEYFGGAPQVIIPDNLKSAVIKPGRFSELNRNYLELAKQYRCVIEPARVRRPQDKSLAEQGVLQVTRWITVVLRRRKFFSVSEINEAIPVLLDKLNKRPFRRLPGNRYERFIEFDKPALNPLPKEPYELAEWVTAQKVPSDYHVYVAQHAYSVPYQLISQKVEARVTHNKVELFHDGKRVAWHQRSFSKGMATTNDAHRPSSHQAYARQSSDFFLSWGKSIGQYTHQLISHQFIGHASHSVIGTKACSRLQSLARHYGEERLEQACKCACDIQSLTVSSVRSILQCKLDQKPETYEPQQGQLPLHINVRGAEYYQLGGK